MPLSPICVVSDNGGPFLPTTNGVDVQPNDPVQIQLQNPTGVSAWFLIIYGTDELTSPPTLANVNPGNGQVTSPTSIVSFTYPGVPAGRAIVFQSTVVAGSNTATTTYAIYSRTPNGDRVAAVGETREGNVSFGWAATLNPIMRSGAAYLYYNDGLANPPTGATTIQGAIDFLKTHGSAAGDLGAIHPRAQSTHGPGGLFFLSTNPPGSVLVTTPAFINSPVFDPLQVTVGLAPAATNLGPFVWGLSGAGVWRYETQRQGVTIVPMDDIAQSASTSSSVVQDTNGNIWTIEATSNTLLQVNQEPPKVVATFAIPNSSKNNLTYDPVHNALILSTSDGTNKVCRFLISTLTFTPDTTIGTNPNEQLLSASIVAGGALFLTSYDTTGVNAWVYKVNPTTLAVLGTYHLAVLGAGFVIAQAVAWLANAGTPKLFVSYSIRRAPAQSVYRIDVGAMTQDATFAVPGSNDLSCMAFNPNDSSLWVGEGQGTPSVVYQLTNVLGSFTLANTYSIDPSPSSTVSGIVWDTVSGQFWVTCGSVDSINSLSTTGSVSTTPINTGTVAIPPGVSGQVFTSNGPGQTPTWSSAGGFTDNATALRAKTARQLTSLDNVTINFDLAGIGINLIDNGPNTAGQAITSVGRNIYFAGADVNEGNTIGSLYSVSLITQTNNSGGPTPIHVYSSNFTSDPQNPIDLIGFRNYQSPENDYIFALCPEVIELGLLGSSPAPNSPSYTLEYQKNILALTGSPNAVRGAMIEVFRFVFSATDNNLYLVDGGGNIHLAVTKPVNVSSPGPIAVDDYGGVWVAYNSTAGGNVQSLVRYTFDRDGNTLAVDKVIPSGWTFVDLSYDGRFIWGLSSDSPGALIGFDASSGGSALFQEYLYATVGFLGRLKWDGESFWVTTGADQSEVLRFTPNYHTRSNPAGLITLGFGADNTIVSHRAIEVTDFGDIAVMAYDADTPALKLTSAYPGGRATGFFVQVGGVPVGDGTPFQTIQVVGGTVTDVGNKTVSITGGGSSGDNGAALRMGPMRRYLADDQDDFITLVSTGLTDSDTTSSYAGGDIWLSENKLYYCGTLSGAQGAIFSYDLACDRVQRVNNGSSGNVTLPGPHNLSGAVSFGYPFGNTFQFHMVGAAGITLALDGELPYDSNQVASYAADTEDWTGARIAYAYQDEANFGVNTFWTAPGPAKIYTTAAQGNGKNLAYQAPLGSLPTAICVDHLNNLWVSLYGTGQVLKFTTDLEDQNITLVGTFTLPNVVDMCSDGQYIWCLQDTKAITRLDQSGNIHDSYSGTSFGNISHRNRMAFDGISMWVSSSSGVTRFSCDNLSALFFDSPQAVTDMRGICVDRNGVVYMAFMANPGPALGICYFNPLTGTRPKTRTTYTQAFTNAGGSTPTLPFNVLTIATPIVSSGFGLPTTVYYEITATASENQNSGAGSAVWKKSAVIGGTGNTLIGTIDDLIPPRISTQAITDGVSFTLSFASNTLTGTINHTHNTYQWAFEIREVRADFGQF